MDPPLPREVWDMVHHLVAAHNFHRRLQRIHSALLTAVEPADPDCLWDGILRHQPTKTSFGEEWWRRGGDWDDTYQWGKWSVQVRDMACFDRFDWNMPLIRNMRYTRAPALLRYHGPYKELSWPLR